MRWQKCLHRKAEKAKWWTTYHRELLLLLMGCRQEQILQTSLWFSTVTDNEFGQEGIEQDLQVLHHLHLKREGEQRTLSYIMG